jgi:hypothetical protein
VRKDHPEGKPMTHKDQRHFEIENREAVLIVRVDGGPHALFCPEIANELEELVNRVAALNGSTLGLGAEFAWACDLRVMADGDFFIGHPEVLLGINPGGGGTQRLTRLIGTHRSLVAILEGKPFTPAEALANGAVDELVPQEKVVARAVELAEYFGSRPKGAIAAIKRSVYFGGSMSLSEGLHVERTEFLIADQSKEAQDLMLGYLATTDATGALPLYNPDTYARALESGRVPGRRATDGA